MKNIVIALLGCSVVATSAYIIVLKNEIADSKELAQQSQVAKLPEKAKPKVKPIKEESFDDLLNDELAIDEPEVTLVKKGDDTMAKANDLLSSLLSENEALKEEVKPSFAKGLQQILGSPEAKEFMRTGMKRRMSRSNKQLFRWLDIEEKDQEAMTELMINRNLQDIGTGLSWMTGNQEQSREQIAAAREKMYLDVEELLGEEKAEVWAYWEDSKNERESVQRFNRSLGDNALDDDTSDELVDMMHDKRGGFAELDNLSRPENFDPKEMTPERQGEIIGQVEELHEVYVDEAEDILNEEQLVGYEESLEKQRGDLKGMLEFTHNMFGAENKESEGAETPPAIPVVTP